MVAIAFLPTYAGGYERMFRRLEEIFDWDQPTYGLIDAERKTAILEKMKQRDFTFLDDREWPDLPLVAAVRKARMKPVYIYSNLEALRRGVLKQQRHAEFVPFPRLSDADEIRPDSKLTPYPHHQPGGELLPGRVPLQGRGDSSGRGAPLYRRRGRKGLRLSDLLPDPGGRRFTSWPTSWSTVSATGAWPSFSSWRPRPGRCGGCWKRNFSWRYPSAAPWSSPTSRCP